MEDLQRLETLLKNKDWYFEYSDDQNRWLNGREEHKKIMDLMIAIDDNFTTNRMWNEYAPSSMQKI